MAISGNRKTYALLICAMLLAFGVEAAEPTKESPANQTAPAKGPERNVEKTPEKPKVFVREFSGAFHGEHIGYVATAGETFLKNEKQENTASMFSVAYVKKGVT